MIFSLIKLVLTFPFIFVLPGFFLLLAVFGWKNEKISFFEKAVLVVPMSLISVDLLVLALNRLHIFLNGMVLIGVIIAFSLLCYIVFQLRFRKKTKKKQEEEISRNYFEFSYWQAIFILISIFLAVFMRTTYLSDTIIPSSTDLGHHMFWVQKIVDTGSLPDYGMPDFIIGEHIVFAVVNLVSGASIMSAMPVLVLLFLNIVGIFTLSILAGRIFQSPKTAAMIFFVSGVLYAINAPQGKYVSGGVVGNIIGNMLIPVALYFLYRAFSEKDSSFAGLFLFSAAGLLYTHHLSAFILLYSIAAVVLAYLALNFERIFKIIGDWLKIFLKPFPIAIFLLLAFYFLFIFTPSYFNPAAVAQATGEPTKITRIGLNLGQLEANAGSARLILGALGFALLFLSFKRKDYKFSFAFAWALVLMIMSWKPGWLYVNIPSDRIGNYLYLPFSLLAAFSLVELMRLFRKSSTIFLSTAFLFVLLFFVITDGLSDSADAFKVRPQFQEVMETFHSAKYLAEKLDTSQDILLKDHVNISGDSWYKLFFMKDYNYPLSRGMLFRYIDSTKPRETCTRDMISNPESPEGQACFSETGVNYIALNVQLEGNSFEKYPDFSKIYSSNYIAVFKRN
ncbi:MAG: hypothetical protein PHP25_00735 [Candidatus Moranbacteria bacterium]|nr:hypothetical protein [Candidatus Moranbacteria bacterium]